jgi:hypothetical protein
MSTRKSRKDTTITKAVDDMLHTLYLGLAWPYMGFLLCMYTVFYSCIHINTV